MSTLSFAIILIGLLVFITPPMMWFLVVRNKSRGVSSFRLNRAHKLSWFICTPLTIVIVALAIGVGYI